MVLTFFPSSGSFEASRAQYKAFLEACKKRAKELNVAFVMDAQQGICTLWGGPSFHLSIFVASGGQLRPSRSS